MIIKLLKILFLTSIIFASTSCNDDEEVKEFEGDIVGFVKLVDTDGYESYVNSGIKVTIENTEYSCETNDTGRFEFNDVPIGTYNFIYEKEGYGKAKKVGVQFAGGNIPTLISTQRLYKYTNTVVSDIEITSNDSGEFNIVFNENMVFSGELTFYAKDRIPISDTNFDYMAEHSYFRFYYNDYNKGDTIYIVGYTHNYYEPAYFDWDCLKYRYTTSQKATETIPIVY